MKKNRKQIHTEKLNLRLKPLHKQIIKKLSSENKKTMSVITKDILEYYFNNVLPAEFLNDIPNTNKDSN
jgi:hypothetical protein